MGMTAELKRGGNAMTIIEVNGLAKTFRTRERAEGLASSLRSFVAPRYREREAVKPVCFALEPGEVLAFIGPNGAGKSTTIKMLTGILYPTAGNARVLGYVPWRQRRQLAFHIASIYGQKSQFGIICRHRIPLTCWRRFTNWTRGSTASAALSWLTLLTSPGICARRCAS